MLVGSKREWDVPGGGLERRSHRLNVGPQLCGRNLAVGPGGISDDVIQQALAIASDHELDAIDQRIVNLRYKAGKARPSPLWGIVGR